MLTTIIIKDGYTEPYILYFMQISQKGLSNALDFILTTCAKTYYLQTTITVILIF